MIFGVGADGVPFLIDPAHHAGERTRHLADQEVGRLDTLLSQDVEDLVRIGRQRTVVEGDNDFLVRERQALRILHHADLGQLAGFKHQDAARSERVGVAGTILRARRRRGNERAGQADNDRKSRPTTQLQSTHAPFYTCPVLGSRPGTHHPLQPLHYRYQD